MSTFKKYWLFVFAGISVISLYPIYMGLSVIFQMMSNGSVASENFPKYIIPYTPVAISVIIAAALMPLLFKHINKLATTVASAISIVSFFIAEFLFESKVIVTDTVQTTLESWQMYACYVSPEAVETRTWKAVDVLIGDYNPLFKLHFYLISVLLILSVISNLYGYGKRTLTDAKKPLRPLICQSVCTLTFLSLCIFACFTAFYRTGDILVSPHSAFLMVLFFIVMGLTAGVYIASFFVSKKPAFSLVLPGITASVITLFMYIGEMILLSGNLYRFGTGFFFEGLPGIVLAPVDILTVILSGLICYFICRLINEKRP